MEFLKKIRKHNILEKRGKIRRWIFSLGIISFMVMTSSGSKVKASEINDIQNCLDEYFENIYKSIEYNSHQDFYHEDFESINGYIVAKQLVSKREVNKNTLGGIINSEVTDIIIDDVTNIDDKVVVTAYVKYKYGNMSDDDICHSGMLYTVTMKKYDNSFFVTDLDSNDIETQIAKSEIIGKTPIRNTYSYYDAETDELEYQVADSYFAKIEKNSINLM